MIKRIFFIFVIILSLSTIFAVEEFVDVISRYSILSDYNMKIEVEFEIESTPIFFSINLEVQDYKLFKFTIEKPDLFQGIVFYYDLPKDILTTNIENTENSTYHGVKRILSNSIEFLKSMAVLFDPEKFYFKKKYKDNYIIYDIYPKTHTLLKIMGIDFVKLKIYLKKSAQIYYLDRVIIANSNERKKVIFKISITTPIQDK